MTRSAGLTPTRYPVPFDGPPLSMSRQLPNLFAGHYLERASHRRRDDAWLAAAKQDPAALIVPVVQGRSFISRSEGRAAAWFLENSSALLVEHDAVFLGEFHERICFAVDFSDTEMPLEPHLEVVDLRFMAGQLPADEAGVLAYARALMLWRERHRFCGRCGAPTRPHNAGHVLLCSNQACKHQQFPRIDPAIITLITDTGGERALLGRQASWPPGRYSTIAGFVEPGESLEDAVIREVLEETGVHVDAVEYHSSQPWPFPSSLMIGFVAYARTTAIELHDQELEDARWFTREDIARGGPVLPMPTSVSYRLIEDWYDSQSERPLREILGSMTATAR